MSTHDQSEDQNENWVAAAIAQQEEHLKRSRSCSPDRWPNGFTQHRWADFGVPSRDGTIQGAAMYRACITCGVTETDADYQVRLAATAPPDSSAPRT